VLGTVAAYAPALQNGLVFDDNQYITNNQHVTEGLSKENFVWAWTTGHASNWHPLTWLSLQLDAQAYGTDRSWGFHLTNLILHIANTLLLFSILERSTRAIWQSGLVAALFALHPLHVESVAWVAERKDVLSTLFGFLAIWFYVRYSAHSSLRDYLLVFLMFALSLLAKPMLVTLPLVLFLLDYWPLGRWPMGILAKSRGGARSSIRWLFIEKLPLLVLSVASCVATIVAQQAGGAMRTLEQVPLHYRIANALVSYVAYLGQTALPRNLTVFYPLTPKGIPLWQVIGSAGVLAAVTLVAALQIRRRPYVLVGWLWYLGMLVPVIGLVQVGIQSRADRYTYVPLVGVFIIVSWGFADLVARWEIRGRVLVPAAGLLLVACLISTRAQIGYWRDEITLWEHAAQVTPDNAIAHNNIGKALLDREGSSQADQLVAAADRIKMLTDAEEHFAAALRINPGYMDARYNLGLSLEAQGKLSEASQAFAAALSLDPQDTDARFHLGLIEERQGKLAQAANTFADLIQRQPNDAELRQHLGLVLVRSQRFEEALPHLVELARLTPDRASAHYQLGLVHELLGHLDQASTCFHRAIALQPSVADYYANLGYVLSEQKQTAEAKAAYQRAFELDPNWPQVALRNAWSSATDPEPARRNGPLGVMLAKKVYYALGSSQPVCLDTLAAAYAEVGEYDRAVSTARQALALTAGGSSPDLARKIQERIQLYESKRPFRQN
jgi:tetratricopeptide (TPR) repeat protein